MSESHNLLPPNKKLRMTDPSNDQSASASSADAELDAKALNKFSRQNAALGAETTAKLSKMRVLIYGLQGLGVEVAKNLALQGVGALTLVDETPTSIQDTGLNFFLQAGDVGRRRSECVLPRLLERTGPGEHGTITGI